MSYQKTIREQIANRCNRIAKLVKLDAPSIILDNENMLLQESLSQYEQNDIVSEPRFENDSDEEHNEWVDYCLRNGHVSIDQWRKING